MSPEIERAPRPYAQIAAFYRDQILSGGMPEGTRLPPLTEIVREWRVSTTTAARALALLQGEGLVHSSARGTVVAARGAKAVTPQLRLRLHRRTGVTSMPGEENTVLAAEVLGDIPGYIADYLDLPDGHWRQVVRREWVTAEDGVPGTGTARALTVTWYPASFAAGVPRLLSQEPGDVGLMLGLVEGYTGPAERGQDWFHARGADVREGAALRVPPGTPLGALTWKFWNASGALVEYGEQCLLPRHTLTYSYPAASAGELEGNLNESNN